MDTVLELKNVTIELGGETILEKIDFSVAVGETIVLIGPSGSGKTVLLKTLMGLYTPVTGQVLCFGHDWTWMSPEEHHDISARIGMQFQKAALFDEKDAFGNVEFVLREHKVLSEEKIFERVMECLSAVGLEGAASQFPYEMSGGMRLRLGIARAIALKPEILLFDDPTAGLDPVNRDILVDLLLEIKKRMNATVIVVTHEMAMAYQMNGRIFLVVDKKLIETGTAAETKRAPDPRVQQFIHGWIHGPLTDGRESRS